MKNVRWLSLAVVLGASVGLVLLTNDAEAQKTKGKTRAASTKQLMKGLVAANCGDLSKLLKADPVNWDDVALKAALINEASYILMDDGRCPDKVWADAAKSAREATGSVLAAAEKKDLAAANDAFKKLTAEGCGACHKAHKGQ